MIKNNVILFLIFISLCTSCKSQEIRIVIDDKNDETPKTNIEVFNVVEKDTVIVKAIKSNYYQIRGNKERTLLVFYDAKSFKIKNVNNEIKSIFIDYERNAQDGCYVINKVFSDAVQSSNSIDDFKDCKKLTNIYLYREYEPDRKTSPTVKLRKKN